MLVFGGVPGKKSAEEKTLSVACHPGFDDLCRKYRGAFSVSEIEEYWLEETPNVKKRRAVVVEVVVSKSFWFSSLLGEMIQFD